MSNDTAIATMEKTNTLILFTRLLGAIGMLFPIMANFIPPSNTRAAFFVIGCILMFVAAAVEKELFFSILQLIVLAGASMYFTPFGVVIKAAVPISLSVIFLIFYAVTGRLQDKLTLLGSLGVVLLALGYGVSHPYIYLFGGAFLAIYSTIAYFRGVTVALLWAILNIFFTLATISNIIRF